MNRYSLKSLLLWLSLIGVSTALYVEYSRPPQILYLHIYSPRYYRNYLPYDPDWDFQDKSFPNNARIATVAFLSGKEFYADLGDHGDPAISVDGKLRKSGPLCQGVIDIDLNDPGMGAAHRQKAPFALDRLYSFDAPKNEFYFAVSESPDPYSLDYRLR